MYRDNIIPTAVRVVPAVPDVLDRQNAADMAQRIKAWKPRTIAEAMPEMFDDRHMGRTKLRIVSWRGE